jgi:hypothetical protein
MWVSVPILGTNTANIRCERTARQGMRNQTESAMSRFLVLSVIVASLSTIVGCGASAHSTRSSVAPSGVNVAEVRDEACWTAPEEVAMQIREAKAPEASASIASENLKGSFRPNRQERPASGAVHAATY